MNKNNLHLLNEGGIPFYASQGKISSKLDVFYNPVMVVNRDITLLFVESFFKNKNILFLDGFSASGIRGIRLMKNNLANVVFNDISKDAFQVINENLKINNILATVENLDFDELVLKYKFKYDFIDIDPFGTPNPFLDLAVKYAKNGAIIAVTATDTAALTGTYPNVAKRKYWFEIQKNEMMHELGLRGLIRKCQLHGLQYEKAMIVKLAYYKDHYFRIFFQVEFGKEKCEELMKEHKYYYLDEFRNVVALNLNDERKNQTFGPIYVGNLYDKELLTKMYSSNQIVDKKTKKFLDILISEYDTLGFLDLHTFAKLKYISKIPKIEDVVKLGATRTHFSATAIKSSFKNEELLEKIKSIIN
ncbi:MAG: hypothetical protein QXS41_01715 [Candidatus Woesearchaeota archaeon]